VPFQVTRLGGAISATSARSFAAGWASSKSRALSFSHGAPPIHVARENSLLHSGQRSTSVNACHTDSTLHFATVECCSLIDILGSRSVEDLAHGVKRLRAGGAVHVHMRHEPNARRCGGASQNIFLAQLAGEVSRHHVFAVDFK